MPSCAARATFLVCLFGACLNPMPEEFPSNEGATIDLAPGTGGGAPAGVPALPDNNTSGSGGDFYTDDGNAGASGDPSASEPPPSAGEVDGDGEAGAPDAGADAAAPTLGGSDSEGETAP